MDNEIFDKFKEYALESGNYKRWRRIHSAAFGNIFSDAFKANEEARLYLTATLIDISQRNFDNAVPKLSMLEEMCSGEFDVAAVDYFTGLNYEMMGETKKMAEYYESFRFSSVKTEIPLSFHPYYRTGKFAQRDSECSEAIYYYSKALEFYENSEKTPQAASNVGHVLYDIATVHMYMHHYDRAEEFIRLSCQYSPSVDHHRDYVSAVLNAVCGRVDKCNDLLETLPDFLRNNCLATVRDILLGEDFHYCAVPQDRSHYGDLATELRMVAKQMERMLEHSTVAEGERSVGKKLTQIFSFAKKNIECRAEYGGKKIVVKCKNYFSKSLIAEYKALFTFLGDDLGNVSFVSVGEFGHYRGMGVTDDN